MTPQKLILKTGSGQTDPSPTGSQLKTGSQFRCPPHRHAHATPCELDQEMAAASLFADLLRLARPRNPSVTILRAFPLSLRQPSRPLSSDLANSQGLAVEEEPAAPVDDLRSRIFRLRFPKRSAMETLNRWVGEGRTVTASELREITKDLRKSKRYKHALEVQFNLFSQPISQVYPKVGILTMEG